QGDRDRALELGRSALRAATETTAPNYTASWIWWAGEILGPDTVGGPEEIRRARDRLDECGWRQPLRETRLTLDELARRSA
ncbi:MAG TPA: hypothetical protein VEA19_00815, partial [Actinomycetota bacterium]|nr:hypothetical protein [Actinomycetota bacterium]